MRRGPSIQITDSRYFSLDRIEAYFYPVPEIFHPYVDAVNYLREHNAKEIGIDSSIYEYPIRVLVWRT